MLDCHNISYSIGKNTLLRYVSWQFAQGKITSIIGANGAGKSTLLKGLLGIVKPDVGRVDFQGVALSEWTLQELALRRAYMAQHGTQRLALPVVEYLLLARVHYTESQSSAEQHVQHVINELDLIAMMFKRLDELSGGEYQRVELARAWCQLLDHQQLDGKLLLLDEPGSALDINQSQKLYQYLRKFVAAGGSVIVVEHDLNVAAKYCDEMLLLKQGQCLAAGKTNEVFTQTNLNQCFNVNGQVVHDEKRGVMSFSL
ncbi:ATP-binding cassette domain-containing protein [Alteromonas sp. ASW11-36]|uniref:ATP-binding cassette domain-containing protein n=1 Tax=Alteromonas arenosi TaxID=3055817 RepID=A0ABT7T021_9ALTE|nr:ATP-binding cassette domain-containing protein [Alteromonas sp. ASW11-36]MDM7861134.1 ATP-binding cassette domain-containing protein [Alteromonas sp. ASW11-36]